MLTVAAQNDKHTKVAVLKGWYLIISEVEKKNKEKKYSHYTQVKRTIYAP